MKYPVLAALLLAACSVAPAAETKASKSTQTGKLSTVRLLASQRISGKGAPDGIRFLVMVTRAAEAKGAFTLKETRDFLLDGESYQKRSETELGKRIEPSTVFDSAEGFFAKQPGARRLAPEDITGSHVLTIAIAGAPLEAGTKVELTLHVGFDKEVEPFTFTTRVPPGPSNAQKKT